MNERFAPGKCVASARKPLTNAESLLSQDISVHAQAIDCGQDALQNNLAACEFNRVIRMTNGRTCQIRPGHSTRVHIKRLLQSTGLAVALGSFLPLPVPVTGIVFDPAAYADPYTGAIPK